ncbi:hypothetical protein ACVW1A_000576 [Bradyrhizobium sp. LB1.3]
MGGLVVRDDRFAVSSPEDLHPAAKSDPVRRPPKAGVSKDGTESFPYCFCSLVSVPVPLLTVAE